MTKRTETSDEYEVGYGKPPAATRFKKGQSGNPKGRKPGAKGIAANIERELERKIIVREGGREIQITKGEALAKTLLTVGLKGNTAAIKLLAQLTAETGESGDPQHAEAARDIGPAEMAMLRDYLANEGFDQIGSAHSGGENEQA